MLLSCSMTSFTRRYTSLHAVTRRYLQRVDALLELQRDVVTHRYAPLHAVTCNAWMRSSSCSSSSATLSADAQRLRRPTHRSCPPFFCAHLSPARRSAGCNVASKYDLMQHGGRNGTRNYAASAERNTEPMAAVPEMNKVFTNQLPKGR